MATHSSILAWRIPWTEEPGGLQSAQFSHSGVSDSLRPHGLQQPGLPVHHQAPEFTLPCEDVSQNEKLRKTRAELTPFIVGQSRKLVSIVADTLKTCFKGD